MDRTQFRPPVFKTPPIIEVVCGVTFETLRSLLVPHLGLLWEKYRTEYPQCQEAVPLLAQIEKPEGTIAEAEIANLPPLPRVQLRNPKGDGMIQVQRERFHYNWQKVNARDEYPRFEAVFALYEEKLNVFKKFLAEFDLGQIVAKQYELTYVDQMLEGEGWESTADIGNIFPDLVWRQREGRPTPESVAWRASFMLPHEHGRLHVSVRSATRTPGGTPALIADFTARGMTGTGAMEGMSKWFRNAHDHIVEAFQDLCSDEIQRTLWGRAT